MPEDHVQRQVLRQPEGRLITGLVARAGAAAVALTTLALTVAPAAIAASGRLGVYADGPTALAAGPGGRTIESVFATCARRRHAPVAYSLFGPHRVSRAGGFAFAGPVRIRGTRVTVRVRGRFTRAGARSEGTITARGRGVVCRAVRFRAAFLGISAGEPVPGGP